MRSCMSILFFSDYTNHNFRILSLDSRTSASSLRQQPPWGRRRRNAIHHQHVLRRVQPKTTGYLFRWLRRTSDAAHISLSCRARRDPANAETMGPSRHCERGKRLRSRGTICILYACTETCELGVFCYQSEPHTIRDGARTIIRIDSIRKWNPVLWSWRKSIQRCGINSSVFFKARRQRTACFATYHLNLALKTLRL